MPKLKNSLLRGIRTSMRQLESNPGFWPVVRNGGIESYVRGHILSELERSTGCMVFTEAESKRIDITLMAIPDGQLKAAVEIKHNYVKQHPSIIKNKYRAAEQLEAIKIPGAHKYYLHLITALSQDESNNPLAQLHNRLVKTKYKEFLAHAHVEKEWARVVEIFESKPLGIIRLKDKDFGLAKLGFWLFQHQNGHLQPT